MPVNNPNYIVVHHTGGVVNDAFADTSSHTFEQVNAWHRADPNIWLGYESSLGYAIGYHYFIDKKGKVTQGRLDTDEGAHCKGHNKDSIGICLAGNFDVTFPTKEQVTSLTQLLIDKVFELNIPLTNVVAHRTFSPKSCYGKNLSNNWAQDLLKPVTPAICTAEKETIKNQTAKIAWYENLISYLLRLGR